MAKKQSKQTQRQRQRKAAKQAQKKIEEKAAQMKPIDPEEALELLKWLENNEGVVPEHILQTIRDLLNLSDTLFQDMLKLKSYSAKIRFLIALGLLPKSESSGTARKKSRKKSEAEKGRNEKNFDKPLTSKKKVTIQYPQGCSI